MNESSAAMAATIDEPYIGPVQGKERFSSIDVIRGVALFGILLMNIIGFAHGMGFQEFTREPGPQGPNFWVWAVENTLFEGTQRTLFSLLFGAGVIILTSRAEQRGAGIKAADIFYRRNIWLIAFGMVNSYLLLWDGDILYYYGLAALFLFPLRNMKPRHLLMIGIAGLFILIAERQYDASESRGKYAEFQEVQAFIESGGTPDEEMKQTIKAWEETVEDFQFNEADYLEAVQAHTRSYGSVFMRHLPELTNMHGNYTYRYIFLDVFSIMVIGMALMKLGVLTLERSRRFYLLLMLAGYGIGLPLSAWETSHLVANDFSIFASMDVNLTYDIGRLANGTGHLGLLLLFVRTGKFTWLQDRLAAVGRMALTNYLMHSVLAAFIFLGVGFGLYGYYERYQLYFIVLAICLFQLLVSGPWLDRYRFGPVEWLWRSLTYLRKQPMRR